MDNIKRPYKQIGDRINTLLAETNTDQKQLAEELNVKANVISYYCGGIRQPPLKHLIAIAKFFNTSVDYLLSLSDVKSLDKDIKSVCSFTGLSEKASLTLNQMNKLPHYNIEKSGQFEEFYDLLSQRNIDVLNKLIENGSIFILTYYLKDLVVSGVLCMNTDDTELLKESYWGELSDRCDLCILRIEQLIKTIVESYDCRIQKPERYKIIQEAERIRFEEKIKNILAQQPTNEEGD